MSPHFYPVMNRPLPPSIDRARHRARRLRNALQSVLLLGGMMALLAACGWIVAGPAGVFWTVAVGAFGLVLSPRISPRIVLRLFDAQPLSAHDLPEVHQIMAELARRAGLAEVPRLYFISSPTMNAVTVGSRDSASVAVTGGLLRGLDLRELAGVLAHELSHIRNNDMWLMGLADMVSRMTRVMSFIGLLLAFLNLSLTLAGTDHVPWLLILLLVFAPTIGSLLQLALARTREYDADREAAALTGDPAGLASALQRLERYQGRFWEEILLPGRRIPNPSVLRTHPPTDERVRRLMELSAAPEAARIRIPVHAGSHPSVPPAPHAPRWRRFGMWY